MEFIKTKSVYLSGQITGLHIEEARKNFDRAAENFNWEKTTVINPIEYGEGLNARHLKEHGRAMEGYEILLAELNAIADIETVFMLRHWEKSPGATIEHDFAKYCGKNVLYEV